MHDELVCEFCGKEDNTVSYRMDPYAADINGDYTLHDICDTCYSNFADDV